jgi:hypothetical protein
MLQPAIIRRIPLRGAAAAAALLLLRCDAAPDELLSSGSG